MRPLAGGYGTTQILGSATQIVYLPFRAAHCHSS